MTAGRVESRHIKIRRRGRHKSPSQVEKVAAGAGKAAPAMAIAGALVTIPQAQHAYPQAQHAAAAAVKPAVTVKPAAGVASHQATMAVKATLNARHAKDGEAVAADTSYTVDTSYKVRAGDSLSGIARQFYGKADDWQWLYHENGKVLSDPDSIYPGQKLSVPADPPAHYTLPDYRPRHARTAGPRHARTAGTGTGTGVIRQSASGGSHHAHASAGGGRTSLSGTLGCSGLERLWEDAGGNPGDAFMAAEIAMAESGGNQYAVSPTDDYGYWQINASNGPLATFSAYGNARAAVILSGNGSDWSPWTTYTSGAYSGRC